MIHKFNSNTYNPVDYYLIVFREDGKIYQSFRLVSTADSFLKSHPLKDELEVIINPKYKK